MIPTPLGLLFILVGIALLWRPPVQMLAYSLVCTLFSAASAIDLPALGGSSIPPAMTSLGFLALRVCMPDVRRTVAPGLGLTANAWLICFCIYCAATSQILPRMFAGKIALIPLGQAGLGFVPLHPSPQNITQAVYMLGTAFGAFAATTLATRPNSVRVMVQTAVVVTWIQVVTGVADVLLAAVHFEGAFDIVRNGSYAQLDQGVGSLHRISAMCSEPSVYADIGAVYFTFMCELWMRRIMPRRTGPAALAMAIMIALSTSTTGYVALAAYGLILTLRAMLMPGAMTVDRFIILFTVTACGMAAALMVAVAEPRMAKEIISVFADMTVNKGQSRSALERGLWAKQGLDALISSHGLGVGVGSFRSSGLLQAILGSVGPGGLLVFLGYCLQLAKLGRRSTYVLAVDERTGAGAAAGWTAVVALAPAAASFAAADPGILFALMAGLSLGWRSKVLTQPRTRWAMAGATPRPA